ncbi:MAG: tetratricopeptide repeat protein [Leptolyngbyaceae cyanobacterium bins.349]|nr:tetratricopeptide repeat protein [Leptolyngbyaceae cyanobacterium bins.349]
MGAEDVLERIDQLIFRVRGEHLSDLRRGVFRGAWSGQTYEEIATELGYGEAYIREEGANLFRLLSDILGERVTKTSFRAALERYQSESDSNTILTTTEPEPPNRSDNGTINSTPAIAPPRPIDAEQSDPNFIGREPAIAHLNQLVRQGSKLILIQGEGGRGKTTLARKYFKTQGFDRTLELWMAAESRNITLVESVVEEWLRRDFNEEPGRDFGINLDRLKRQLRDGRQRIGILIDNLESALDRNGKFLEAHRPYVDLLKALSDSSVQAVTLITSRERLSESSITLDRYLLEGLNESAWQHFFQNRGLNAESGAIAQMWNAYGGNAKAMKLLSGVILQDFDGDVAAFWQENSQDLLLEPELKDLVASQFDRLQRSNPEAYKLLCRLGCYRYQEVHYVNVEGLLHLLWDIPELQRRSTVRALQDRSLIEVRKGKYWLHPVIRAEAIARLRHRADWQETNHKAAEFWMQSVQRVETIDDALKTLEAYYHYLEIRDFQQACDLLTAPKPNRWGEGLSLGWLFYRLGLLQQMIFAITRIISNVETDDRLGKLYILLGYNYRLAGSLQQALDCFQKADEIATTLNLNSLKVAVLFNRALCLRDLAEIDQAIALFTTIKNLAEATHQYPEYQVYSLCGLAYLKSRLGLPTEAINLAIQARQHLASTRLSFWGLGYNLLFLGSTYRNLGRLDEAFQLYHETIQISEENHFTQIRAKALHGIAQLFRERELFETALQYHLEAIYLLDKIGAKCDLAEAYYQLGMTYRSMGDRDRSLTSLQQALHLFNIIQAPKQAEQVQHTLQHT